MTPEEQKKKKQREEEEARRRPKTDDEKSITGTAFTDGMLGIPSSPTAIAVDIIMPGGLFNN